ncbi:MAG: hypothetical protein FJW79_11030, partial [Actinobacteria bacterium]|nr:hypothetical protein [Actinomycetota bacterium]
GLTRQTFLLATQEMAAAADAVAALGSPAPAATEPEPEPEAVAPEPEPEPVAPEPQVIIEPAPAVAATVEMPAAPAAAGFSPTHEVPAGGMSAWAAPDPNLPPIARLEARVQLRVDEVRGAWARVTGSNGWSGWVDDRRLAPLGGAPVAAPAPAVAATAPPVVPVPATAPLPAVAPQPAVWQATHQVPAEGLPAWATPDPAAAPIAQLAGRVQLRIEETRGAWARVTGSNGWSGWVDARRLGPLGRGGGGLALGPLALRPLPLVGGIALIVASFLPWLKGIFGASSTGGWNTPFQVLWNTTSPGDQPRMGLIVLIVGIIALAAGVIPKAGRALAAITGVLAAVIGALYIVQVIRLFSNQLGASAGDVLNNAIGIAPWIALGGALLLLIGALIPDRRG